LLVAASVFVVLGACPRSAFADPPAPVPLPATTPRDSIYLKNGGVLRGTLVDVIPGDHARIELVTHEIESVAWADVLRVEQGEPPTLAPAPPSSAAVPAPESFVTVHIEGADGALLEQDTTGDGDWRPVCTAPCDRPLSIAYGYRVAGGGLRGSSRFSLRGRPGARETLVVSPASKGWFIVGVVAAPVGGVVAYAGLFAGIFGSLGYTSRDANGTQRHAPSAPLATAGWTMVGVGGAVGVAGVVLIWSNWKTGVAQEIGTEPTGAPGSRESSRTVAPLDAALPMAPTVPLVMGRF
jgi:hypothetical protein